MIDLDVYLQKIYHEQTELVVVFLCREYEQKEWCGIEWRAIRDLIKKKRNNSIMLFRFDNAEISGVFSIDGYIDANINSPDQAANLIYERLLHTRGQLSAHDDTIHNKPQGDLDPKIVLQAAEELIRFLSQESRYEQKLITLPPPQPTQLDRILDKPFFMGGQGNANRNKSFIYHVQKPKSFTDDFWAKYELVAKAAKSWNIPKCGAIFRLLRLRPDSDQDKSLEEYPNLLEHVRNCIKAVADQAVAQSMP